jgi:hypothetical protein
MKRCFKPESTSRDRLSIFTNTLRLKPPTR